MTINTAVEAARTRINHLKEKPWGRLALGVAALVLPFVLGCGRSEKISETVVPKPTKTPETRIAGELGVGQKIEAVVCPIIVPADTKIRRSPYYTDQKINPGTVNNIITVVPQGKELVIHGGRVARDTGPKDPAGVGRWYEFVLPDGQLAYVAHTKMTKVTVPPDCWPPKTYTIEQLAHQGIYLIKDLTGKIEVIGGSEFRDVQSSQ